MSAQCSLDAEALLEVWERARRASPWRQALLLLAAAWPGATPEMLARLSIGQRNRRLLTLRNLIFGDVLPCTLSCPACDDRLEFTLDVRTLLATEEEVPETQQVQAGEYSVTFRLPNTADLIALDAHETQQAARDALFATCLTEVAPLSGTDNAGAGLRAQQLPSTVQDAVLEEMHKMDPMATIDISLCCPACGHHWLAALDVMAFFWLEIEDWAQRTLRDIHLLATAYSWGEREILNLSAWRRQVYLEMVQA
jgi:hypothetical protein